MKRNVVVVICLVLAWLTPGVALAAVRVFACEPEWGALAREVGAGRVSVFDATTALQDVHRIQARPSLIAQARTADLVVCSGADLEIGWLPLVLQQAGNPRILPGRPGNLEAANYVRLLEVPTTVDRSMGDVHPRGNPHIQWNPRNIETVAAELERRLTQIDPEGSQAYAAAGQDFRKRWTEAVPRWEQSAAPLKGVPVVEHHKALTYLFAWLQMPVVGSLEPKPGVEPTSRYLRELVAQQQLTPARMVVITTVNNPDAADWFAGQVKIPVVQMPYSVGGTPGAKDLFGMYEDGIARLLAGARR